MLEPLRVLIVEDSEDDALLTVRALSHSFQVFHERVESEAGMKAALLERSWDIVISDFDMLGFSGFDAYQVLKASALVLPFIFVSGVIGEDVAVEAMRTGVDDYILKGNLARLAPAVSRELKRAQTLREGQDAERSFRGEQLKVAEALESAAQMQEAVANLGQFALQGATLVQLYERTVQLSSNLLDAQFCCLFSLLPNGEILQLEASVGWPKAVEGLKFPVNRNSHPGLICMQRKAILFEDIEQETRFAPSSLMIEAGIMSGVGVVIQSSDKLYGVVTVHSKEPKKFRFKEMSFLQALANVVATAVERHHLEAQLKISDRLATVGQLAAGVAHEINNPLGYVTANLEMMVAELESNNSSAFTGKSDSLLKMAKEAHEGSERIRIIVKDLTTFSHSSEERPGGIDLEKVLNSSIRMSSNQIRHVANLTKSIASAPLVMGNEGRMGQVILNLLINAGQAIPEGEPSKNEIRVGLTTDKAGNAMIEITDTGSGIPDHILPSIFDPFFTTKAIGVGTGLGLPICRNIILGMGGNLSVETRVGYGTTFRIVLPPARDQTPKPAPTISTSLPKITPEARRLKILLVDDEPFLLEAIGSALSIFHDVVTTTSPKEALSMLNRDPNAFDTIFCDLMMEEMTGMEFYENLVGRHSGIASRVIFMTGGAFTERARTFLETVPNLRLNKPFNLRELHALLQDRIRQ